MYPSVTTKVGRGHCGGTACSYIYISILFCLSPELQLHQLLSYRQLPLIIVVDLWLVLEFFLFLMFGFMSHDFRQLRLGGVFSISLGRPKGASTRKHLHIIQSMVDHRRRK